MKKILSLMLVFLMLFALIACDNKDDDEDDEDTGVSMSEAKENLEKLDYLSVDEWHPKSECVGIEAELDMEFITGSVTFFIDGYGMDEGQEFYYMAIGLEKESDCALVEENLEDYEDEIIKAGDGIVVWVNFDEIANQAVVDDIYDAILGK